MHVRLYLQKSNFKPPMEALDEILTTMAELTNKFVTVKETYGDPLEVNIEGGTDADVVLLRTHGFFIKAS